MESVDILQDDFDLAFSGGDFVTTVCDEYHIRDLLLASQGNFRYYPLLGASLQNYLGSNTPFTEIRRIITNSLEADGYQVLGIDTDSQGRLKIRANKVRNNL